MHKRRQWNGQADPMSYQLNADSYSAGEILVHRDA